MRKTRIKICGITQKEQAEEIAELPVDAMGFILYQKSSRYVSPDKIRDMLVDLPPFLKTVGVFVNESISEISSIINSTGLSLAQLSGDESPEYCRSLTESNIPWMKAIRIRNQNSLDIVPSFGASYVLLDAWSEDEYGGTGKSFDWKLLQKLDDLSGIILAGGITPDNAGAAVSLVRPYAVDVSSGVEVRPGVKNIDKVKQLIRVVSDAGG